jgi:anaerobic magnesium-protoporphyrin IX monomethyl ester cyclase
MRVLFVYSLDNIQSPLKPLQGPDQISYGISYIAGLLKQNGHEPFLVVIGNTWQNESFKIIDKNIKEIEPNIIGFYTIASQYPFILKIANYIKDHYPNIILIAGGPHASINPNEVIEGPFKAICIGEGEYPTLELIQQIEGGREISNIANLWIRQGDQIEKNPTRPFLENLDDLPFPNRDMWYRWIKEIPEAKFSILLGRGCYFNCSYCCNHALRSISSGYYVRVRSPENIIMELSYLYDQFPDKKDYFFEVESFNLHKDWVFALCDELKQFNNSLPNPLTFGTNIRIIPNCDFEKIFAACTKGNIRYLTVGLESGSERIRREIMNRIYSNNDVIRFAELARKYNLHFGFQNMIGLPTETEEDFLQTVLLNRICQPDWCYLGIFFPYPGTKLAERCKKLGLLNNYKDTRIMERNRIVVKLPTFPENRLKMRFYLFDFDVYRGKKPLIKIAAKVIRRVLSSHSASNNIYRLIMNSTMALKVKQILR